MHCTHSIIRYVAQKQDMLVICFQLEVLQCRNHRFACRIPEGTKPDLLRRFERHLSSLSQIYPVPRRGQPKDLARSFHTAGCSAVLRPATHLAYQRALSGYLRFRRTAPVLPVALCFPPEDKAGHHRRGAQAALRLSRPPAAAVRSAFPAASEGWARQAACPPGSVRFPSAHRVARSFLFPVWKA